jgi:Flp pilus assembly protein TadG
MTPTRTKGRGQALAEFALVIPLFLLVFLGVVEGGYYVVATTIVSHATHEGARFGVLDSTVSRAAVRTRVQQRAAPVVSLATGDINLRLNGASCNDACYDARVAGDRLMVRTTYTHRPLVGYVFPGITFPANADSELLVEGAP